MHDRGIVVVELTRQLAQRAGALLARARLSSAHAVDAVVVASAMSFEAAVIATGDPDDMQRLSMGHKHLRIFSI